MLDPGRCWVWKAAQWKRTRGSWSTAAQHEPALPRWAKRPIISWPVSEILVQENQDSDCPPVLGTGEAMHQITYSVLDPSLQDTEVLKHIQRRSTELRKGLEHKFYEE